SQRRHPDPRRGDECARFPDGKGVPGHSGEIWRQPHDLCRGSPAGHHREGRSDHRARCWPHRRAGHARYAAAERGAVLSDVRITVRLPFGPLRPDRSTRNVSALQLLLPDPSHRQTLARAMLDLRSIGGTADYRRFIIVGSARTGSTLLTSLLNAHSQALAFGELFGEEGAIGWDMAPFLDYQGPRLLALYRSDPIAFLQRKVFRRWPKEYG